MTFWDRLKPAEKMPVATSVDVSSDSQSLNIRWEDGAATGSSDRAGLNTS